MRTGTQLDLRFPVVWGALLMGLALAEGWHGELAAQEVRLKPIARLDLPTRISIQNGLLHIRQKVGATFGARLGVKFTPRFNLAAGMSYSPGHATIHGGGKKIEFGTGSHRLGVTTGAQYWLIPEERTFSCEVHTGLAMVFGGRPDYEGLFGSSTLSGAIGTTFRYQLARIVALQMRVQNRLFRVHFGNAEQSRSRSPFQVSFGLTFPFMERIM